tara:strand:+ start:9 stop:1148 length:1140 start_codon:yes stop_codon:yes gene_type:complete
MRLIIFLTLLFNIGAFAQQIEKIQIKGEKEIGKREILIYTPPDYTDKTRSFEVVYVLDAQSREFFDAVHTTLAFQNHGMRPMIVVGIVSPFRNIDFLPKNIHPETVQEQFGELGGADNFSDFIENTVIPYIDENYRTIPTKIGIGYSNGGTFMNYSMLKNPDLFDVIFSIDANFNYDKGQLVDLIENQSEIKNSVAFYYTCQTFTSDLWIENAKRFNEFLKKSTDMKIIEEIFEIETHATVYQQGVLNAFKSYFDYQFFNSQNLVKYLKTIKNDEIYVLSKDELLRMAVVFKNFGKIDDAKNLLFSFQDKLVGEIEGYDIYALFETADLYFSLGFNELAKKYFLYCDQLLEKKKNKYGLEKYNMGKRIISEKLELMKIE